MTKKFQPPRGTRDFLPKDMLKRRILFEKMRKVFDLYGYGEVCTPAFEEFELLSKKSGPEIENEIYAFKDKSGRKLGLRFDPTVPICRIIASKQDLIKPVKFCYITNMWRYDKPGKGRWREFWQSGIEIIGSNAPEADAEVLALASDILNEIGIKNFTIKINSRKLLDELAKKAGIPKNKNLDAFRALDKLEKIGEKGVLREMKTIYKIPEKNSNQFMKLVKASKGSAELEKIKKLAENMGAKNVSIDTSLARGLDYYTGFVFETVAKGFEGVGSLVGGGRYDELIGVYGDRDVPATGFGMGIERIMEVLKDKNDYYPCKVFVVSVKDKFRRDAIKIARGLRERNISADFDLMNRDLRKQLDYANKMKIPYALFVGEKEVEENRYTLRDMKTGKEKKVKVSEINI